MGIQTNENHVHWNYLIALEQDLSKVSRFVEFSEANFYTYSIELAHLLLAASSEVDVVLKALCNQLAPGVEHQNINQHREVVKEYLPDLIYEKCYIHRYGLELTPFSNWQGEESPKWWQAYNKVKHQRNDHFDKAHLKNALNALSALSLVVLYYYREIFSHEYTYTFKDVNRRLKPKTSLIDFNKEYEHKQFMTS